MKKHHPHSRAERLTLKQLEHEKRNKSVGQPKVRRKIIQSLKEQETEDELRQIQKFRDTSVYRTDQ